MAHSEAATAELGHNNPPEPTLRERIEETYVDQFAEIETLATRANALPAEIKTDDDLGAVADVAVAASKLAKKLETLRKAEKEPYLRDGKIVDATFTENRIARLERITGALNQRATAYNNAKLRKADEERRAAERAARDLAERQKLDAAMELEAGNSAGAVEHLENAQRHEEVAREAAAPVKAADLTRVKSEGGATATTRTEVKARVLDWQKIDLNALRSFIKQDAVEAALRLHVKQFKKSVPITGVEFFDDAVAQFRS